MGVDVMFKARPFVPFNDEQLAELRDAFYAEFPDPDEHLDGNRWPTFDWDEDEDEPTIEVDCIERYYDVGYPRGPWPRIRAMGDWLAVRLGEVAEVRYGGDSTPDWESLNQWGKVRDELQALWDES